MAAPSTEERELKLLESVEFKILAVANKETKLHELLQRYLAPVILKAASENQSVRQRVIQILGRLKTFIQPPEVVLPVKALLEQYKSNDSAIIKQLDLSFIQHSLERIDEHDRRELIPIALKGCAADQGQPRASVFAQAIIRLLLDARFPPRGGKDDEALRESLGLSDAADAWYLQTIIAIFLRLKVPNSRQNWAQANPTLSQGELSLFSVENADSQKIFQRLSEVKAKLVALLATAALTDDEKFLPVLYGASSFDNRVSSASEDILRRTSVSLEDEGLVKRLFQAHSSLPVAYRIRILGMLSKSSISTTMANRILGVVHLDLGLPVPSITSAETFLALQPTSVLESTKLHKALFQYLTWVARIGPSKDNFTIAPDLIRFMRSYIEIRGWPIPAGAGSADAIELRSKAYETIGMLSSSATIPTAERLELAQWLFRSLSEDPTSEAVVSIDSALSGLTSTFPAELKDEDEALMEVLLGFMFLADAPPAVRSTRHAVMKWVNQCLPFANIYARWMNIVAIGGIPGERGDVIEQGQKGLDPWTYHAYDNNKSALEIPDWHAMAAAYFSSLITPDNLYNYPTVQESLANIDSNLTFGNFQGTRLLAYPVALRYIQQLIFLTALGDDVQIQPNWKEALDATIRTNIQSRTKIRTYLEANDNNTFHLGFYLRACLGGALLAGSPIVEQSLRCLVEVASLSPPIVTQYLATKSSGLLDLVKYNKKEIRSLAAQAIGIFWAHPVHKADNQVDQFRVKLQDLFANAEKVVGSELNAAEGALLAFGHLCSRSVFYDYDLGSDVEFPLRFLTNQSVQPSLFEAALECFSQLWSVGLGVPTAESLDLIIKRITDEAKKGNEKAIFALGRLAIGLGEDEAAVTALDSIITALHGLHEIKQVEVQFTVGDALTAAIAQWDSDFVKLTLDVDLLGKARLPNGSRRALVTRTLEKLFADCKTTKPSLLKASGIWLFCVIQYCSHLEEVGSRLREAQTAFMRLLSARDELVQETASRGLTLVYESGDAALKGSLVKDLVSAFTGSGTQLKVDQDTELFDAGALPTGDGKSVTSYKDIVNLANEVGDQGLVYKFMSLAANAATWSTRSAFGRFGLGNILSDSEIDPKLYPKLFRYRFDPNPNVQKSMEDIWKAVVKDNAAIMDAYFDAILEDLLKSILGREWRMREASCAAIADLISGRPFKQYEARYRDIWTAALKVLDDVKGSVREAALRLCMALSNGLVRQLEESNQGAAAKAMIQEALPFLLSDKGIESSAKDTRLFCTITVLKIAKQGGTALKPFIPMMVPQLLGLLSTIEPEEINYHYQRAGDDSRDQIDQLRSQIVNRSPISEAIENSMRFIDADVMAQLAPKLEATIKSAIGLPTKIGCSRVLSTLFTRHTIDIKPFSAKFLRLMEKQAMDKNDAVSQAYARAAAYMMRVVPDAAKERFCNNMVQKYLKSEEEAHRQKIADVTVALAKTSPDHFSAFEAVLLPFSYLGAHDTDEYTRKVFGEVWSQHAGSSRTVVRYVAEIVKLVEQCLDTSQWDLRHTGALTTAAMVEDVVGASDTTGEISEKNLNIIWPVLDTTLALKTFPGKEKLLEAFPKFVEKGAALWKNDKQVAEKIKKVAIREAKRNNDEYRVHGFVCLWKIAKARDDLDLLQEIADIVTPHLDEFIDENKMEVDGKEDNLSKAASNGFEAISRGYNRQKLLAEPGTVLGNVLKLLGKYLESPKMSVVKRDVWYDAVYDIMTAVGTIKPAGAASPSSADRDYLKTLDLDQPEAGSEPQRIKRAKALSATLAARLSGAFGAGGSDLAEVKLIVDQAVKEERSLKVLEELRAAQKLLTQM
ncbi:unnamed protein product [Clonostachys solani]|uniref:Proteasome component ECM29 n=1 Tax=Clonostachys solani TaxID=160281 RepID=A0A9N9Z7X4_9HYPO|nr:unnamed protein product [Clonostachys solani]